MFTDLIRMLALGGSTAAVLALAGCRADEPVQQPESVPPGTETLVALLRAQLTAPDPVEAQYRIVCEASLVHQRMGDSADHVLMQAYAAAYGPRDRAARDRIDAALANRVFSVGEAACREPYVDPDTLSSL